MFGVVLQQKRTTGLRALLVMVALLSLTLLSSCNATSNATSDATSNAAGAGNKPEQAQVGAVAPALLAERTLNADQAAATAPFSLADYRGKVVLVDFWATWCGPCVASIPHLLTWQKKYAQRGLQIVGYTDESSQDLPAFIQKHHLTYPIAVASSLDDNAYGISSIPHMVLIGGNGKIIKMGNPDTFNDQDIESALQQIKQ